MVTLFVRHKVGDYDSWKRIYDEAEPMLKEKGVKAASVHRDANDKNTILVTHRFKSLDEAKSFANSEELKAAMARAGLNGTPEFWFTEDVEQKQY